jgi:hypothetical protein
MDIGDKRYLCSKSSLSFRELVIAPLYPCGLDSYHPFEVCIIRPSLLGQKYMCIIKDSVKKEKARAPLKSSFP